MRTIIAGTRTINDMGLIQQAIRESGFNITEVVCGMAKGVDRLGFYWGRRNKIPCRKFYARWERDGKAAGIIRNRRMGNYADALIAIWDGQSPGTKHMIEYARKKGLSVYVFQIKPYQLQRHEIKDLKRPKSAY